MLANKQALAQVWFANLRDQICASYESLEDQLQNSAAPAGRFTRQRWKKYEDGTTENLPENAPMAENGGEMALMRGRVFEKVGVNISTVMGEFSEGFRHEIPGAADDPSYWAAGISLVAHPCSPHVPAAHFNTRMIVVGGGARLWFGGGGDLNPIIRDETDVADFHAALHTACDRFDPAFYPAFTAWCEDYFYIPHRGRPRGAGGIFYDYLGLYSLGEDRSPVTSCRFGKGGTLGPATQSGMELAATSALDWAGGFAFTQAAGSAFRDIYPALVARQMDKEWGEEERALQLKLRGHYAEYNLLYDRGTRFGLMTGGHTEAILMSLPPLASW